MAVITGSANLEASDSRKSHALHELDFTVEPLQISMMSLADERSDRCDDMSRFKKAPTKILVSYRHGYNCSSAHARCNPRMATIQYISSPDEFSSMVSPLCHKDMSYSPLCYLCIRTTPIFKNVVAQFASFGKLLSPIFWVTSRTLRS